MTEPTFAELPYDRAGLYLDLMKRCLLSWIHPDWAGAANPNDSGAVRCEGKDWPARAHTMIGLKRLNNLQECAETALRDDIPGDLLEAGVWRGGAAILMRAVLRAYGVTNRRVWLADSFAGLPPPNPAKYPADEGLDLSKYPELVIPLEQVQENFRRYGLLDEQVRFLKGWFRDTLPQAPVDQLAVLRLDGDLYESTMDILTNLYDKLSPGGFLIVDDYGAIWQCAQAVNDFRRERGIIEPIIPLDWTGIYWRKGCVESTRHVGRMDVRQEPPESPMALPPILQPWILCPDDERTVRNPRPFYGCDVEGLRKQYRRRHRQTRAPVTLASLVFDHEVLERYLRRALAHQDVECQVIIEENGDNHTAQAEFYNRVIDTAEHDHILFVHPDIEFSPWAVSTLLETILRKKDCGAVGVVGVTVQGLIAWSELRRDPREVSTLDGCLIMIDRRHGLRFDEAFDSYHCVVEDYCLQVQARGLRTYVAPGVTAAHFGSTAFTAPEKGVASGWMAEYHACLRRLGEKWPMLSFCTIGGRDCRTQQLWEAFTHMTNQRAAIQNLLATVQNQLSIAQNQLAGAQNDRAAIESQLLMLKRSLSFRAGRLVTLPARALRHAVRRAGIRPPLSRM